MKSQDIANYLIEIASSQRKLEYCRQILAQNLNFTPSAIFSLNSSTPQHTLYRQEFLELLKSFGFTSPQEQLQPIFCYFQIDAKNYISLEKFSTLILPQNDPALKNSIASRRTEKVALDYSLRYSLHKFFSQVIENQSKLDALCESNYERREDSKLKFKKIDQQGVRNFLALHGKYPTESAIESILKELSLNKGTCKRNRTMVEYILEYNDKCQNNLQKQKSNVKEAANGTDSNGKSQKETPVKTNNEKSSKINPSSNCPQTNKVLQEIIQATNKSTTNELLKPSSKCQSSTVEERIKALMGSITIKTQNISSQSKNILSKAASKVNQSQEKQNIKVEQSSQKRETKPQSEFSRIEILQKHSVNRDVPIRRSTVTENHSERRRIDNSFQKREQTFDDFGSSQLTFKPRVRTSIFTEDPKENDKGTSALEKNRQNENAKRIEYLKNLVGENSSSKTRRQVETFRS